MVKLILILKILINNLKKGGIKFYLKCFLAVQTRQDETVLTILSIFRQFWVFFYRLDNISTIPLSSRRAKRAGWPEGLKGPEGTFRPFGPAGALRRRLLHRNGTFVPPAPSTRTRWQVKTGFRRKTGRSRAVCESIRKIPTGKITEILVASQPLIRFFAPKARNGPFCPFFGP